MFFSSFKTSLKRNLKAPDPVWEKWLGDNQEVLLAQDKKASLLPWLLRWEWDWAGIHRLVVAGCQTEDVGWGDALFDLVMRHHGHHGRGHVGGLGGSFCECRCWREAAPLLARSPDNLAPVRARRLVLDVFADLHIVLLESRHTAPFREAVPVAEALLPAMEGWLLVIRHQGWAQAVIQDPALPESFERFCQKWSGVRAIPTNTLMEDLAHALTGVDAFVEAIVLQKTLNGAGTAMVRRRL
jgi:hypothetical protein